MTFSSEFDTNKDRIQEFYAKFVKDQYITWKDRDALAQAYKPLYTYFDKGKSYYMSDEVVMTFLRDYKAINEKIKEHNTAFVDKELQINASFFGDIDGKSLDAEQRRACVVDEYSNLIIAGAGSGKTLTIVGKIKYLVEKRGINPKEILCMSFTRKSTAELEDRLKKVGLDIKTKTFHAIGLENISDKRAFKQGIANDLLLKNVISNYFEKSIYHTPNQMEALIEFLALYIVMPPCMDSFKDVGQYYEKLKNIDCETLRSRLSETWEATMRSDKTTLQQERVKSIEELRIANFLFMNGISYEYECTYPFALAQNNSNRSYQPDFYLTDYGIYLEHFGVSEDHPGYRGYRADWIKEPIERTKYIDGIYWKRQVHKSNQTKLIETYSNYNQNYDLLEDLRNKLVATGVEFKPLSRVSLYKRLWELERNREFFKAGLGQLIITFINLYKTTNCTEERLYARIAELFSNNRALRRRAELFAGFALPLIQEYNHTLSEKNQIDFNDMINLAVADIEKNNYVYPYRYIIIDEYQDISDGRFRLIHAIRNRSNAKLMCVGDDWQAIYRFTGSDAGFFTDFDKYVGYSEKMVISRTYRNSQELIDITKRFIMKNKRQLPKHPVSEKHISYPVIPVLNDDERQGLAYALESIVNACPDVQAGAEDVVILGRHNFDLLNLLNPIQDCTVDSNSLRFKTKIEVPNFIYYKANHPEEELRGRLFFDKYPLMKIKFMTVHSAKGIEAHQVVVINVNNNQYGFPNQIQEDSILATLLSNSCEIAYAEERRLFYVAMTRTKNYVYLVSKDAEKSVFMKEIIEDNDLIPISILQEHSIQNNPTCKYCGQGKMVIRENRLDGSKFLGCTNYPFCEKTYTRTDILNDVVDCPSCGGYMVKRRGEYGLFYGCTNYPDCIETIDIDRL